MCGYVSTEARDPISAVDSGLREIFSLKNTINKVHNAPLALQPVYRTH